MNHVSIAYCGVHQAYQIALAAQEANLLDRFYCSFYDAPGLWGGLLSKALGADALKNRRLAGIDVSKVEEHPWPELAFKLHGHVRRMPSNAAIGVARQFDHWAAKRLRCSGSQVFVGVENCAYESFRTAKESGMKIIYDCPGANAEIWQQTTEEAARLTSLPFVSVGDTSEITRRKEVEISLADCVLTYSDFHTEGVMARGVPRDKIAQIPLWTDPEFWHPAENPRERKGPLKVLFVGTINLRKGVPFLLDAVRGLAPHASLTLVGRVDPDTRPCLAGTEDFATVLAPVHKERLRGIYHDHDVLVLPSLGDSFGFVAMEAMACGLPVILTTHCGAPVPDESWRVPVMDSKAIQERLRVYSDHLEQLHYGRMMARSFAKQYTPQRYRAAVVTLLSKMADKAK